MIHKYLEFKDGASNKFWRIELDGASFTVNFGKVGTAGQTQTKTFDDEDTAKKEAVKLLNSKLKKGYAEAGNLPQNQKRRRLKRNPQKAPRSLLPRRKIPKWRLIRYIGNCRTAPSLLTHRWF